jgi:hypothetical protein
VTTVVIEHTDGSVLARIDDAPYIPRVGEFIEVVGDMLVVRSAVADIAACASLWPPHYAAGRLAT